jgi:hypothetical protein
MSAVSLDEGGIERVGPSAVALGKDSIERVDQ